MGKQSVGSLDEAIDSEPCSLGTSRPTLLSLIAGSGEGRAPNCAGIAGGRRGYAGSVDHFDRPGQRAESAKTVRGVLGIEPTFDALMVRVGTQITAAELAAVIAAVERTPPHRQPYAIAAVAAASLAMDMLGHDWWQQARTRSDNAGGQAVCSPASLVRSDSQFGWICDHPRSGGVGAVEVLGEWAGDDVADHLWGPAVGFVDMNDSNPVDRFPAPANALPGDRLLLSFDPGCRIAAVVERRDDGTLGTRLDGELPFAPPTDLWWHWVTATKN
jgi:hypothetical protein